MSLGLRELNLGRYDEILGDTVEGADAVKVNGTLFAVMIKRLITFS